MRLSKNDREKRSYSFQCACIRASSNYISTLINKKSSIKLNSGCQYEFRSWCDFFDGKYYLIVHWFRNPWKPIWPARRGEKYSISMAKLMNTMTPRKSTLNTDEINCITTYGNTRYSFHYLDSMHLVCGTYPRLVMGLNLNEKVKSCINIFHAHLSPHGITQTREFFAYSHDTIQLNSTKKVHTLIYTKRKVPPHTRYYILN